METTVDLEATVQAYGHLVRRAARRWRGLDREDLEQTGYMALLEAAQRYDPTRGPFPHYAAATIRGALFHYVRDQAYLVRVPRRRFRQGARVFYVSTDERSVSGFLVHDLSAEDPELERILDRADVARTLRRFTPLERQALFLLYYVGLNQYEVAARLDVSQKSVSRIACRFDPSRRTGPRGAYKRC